MFVVGNFVGAVAVVLDVVLQALLIISLVAAILSWIRLDARNPLLDFLDRASDFVCDPLRRLFPTVFGGVDIAPLIAMLVLLFLQRFVVGSLHGLAERMG